MISVNLTLKLESVISKLEPASFQRFCGELIKECYPDSPDLEHCGLEIGDNKTTKGHPDCLLIRKNGKYVFVECTTSEEVNKKCVHDVKECLNEEIVEQHPDCVETIIFCHNRKEVKEEYINECIRLTKEKKIGFSCKGINDLAILAQYHPLITKLYLGIDLGMPLCVFTISEFVKYSARNNGIGLNKVFVGREKEIAEVEEKIGSSRIVVLSGKSGVGKTMLAIESAKKICHGDEFICVIKPGELDLSLIREAINRSSFVIIDDGSRFGDDLQSILEMIDNQKVIITTRDYEADDALRRLRDESLSYSIISLKPLSGSDVETLIKANTCIQSSEYIDYIQRITHGYPRLALMYAQAIVNDPKGYQKIFDNSDGMSIYSTFYSNQMSLIGKLTSDYDQNVVLGLLGLISFLKNLDLSSKNTVDILLLLLDAKIERLREIIKILNEKEIVNYKYDLAVIPDQCFSDYLSYYVLIDKKLISLEKLLFLTIDDNYQNIAKYGGMIVSTFSSQSKAFEYLQNSFKGAWNLLQAEKRQNSLKIFCAHFAQIDPVDCMIFLKSNIADNSIIYKNYANKGDWRLNCLVNLIDSNKIFCLQIVEEMVNSKLISPENLFRFLEAACNLYYLYFLEKDLSLPIFILSKYENAFNGEYKCSLEKFCLEFLKFNFEIATSGDGYNPDAIYRYTIQDGNSEGFRNLRDKCLDVLSESSSFYNYIKEYLSFSTPFESKNVFLDDIKHIDVALKNNPNRNRLEEIYLYFYSKSEKLYLDFEWASLKKLYSKEIEILSPAVETGIYQLGFCKNSEKYLKKMLDLVKGRNIGQNIFCLFYFNFILSKNFSLFDCSFTFIETLFSELQYSKNVNQLLPILFRLDYLMGNVTYVSSLVKLLLKSNDCLNVARMCASQIAQNFKDIFPCILIAETYKSKKDQGELIIEKFISDDSLLPTFKFNLSILIDSSISFETIYKFLRDFLKRFGTEHLDSSSFIFLSKSSREYKFYCWLAEKDIGVLEKIYIYEVNETPNFDSKGDLLKEIVKKDINFSSAYLNVCIKGNPINFNYRRIKSIWSLGNYLKIGDLMFEFLIKRPEKVFMSSLILFGACNIDNRLSISSEQFSWIIHFVQNTSDSDKLKSLCILASDSGMDGRTAMALAICKYDKGEELFELLIEKPFSTIYSGSATAQVDKGREFLENLKKELLSDSSNNLKYLKCINDMEPILSQYYEQAEAFDGKKLMLKNIKDN